MAILELKNIKYQYDKKKIVLNDLSCKFEAGKFYALVGKSGAGKSTLLSLMAHLDKPDEGSICFKGRNIKHINKDLYLRKYISVIYQDFSLFPYLTVLENIMYPMQLNKLKKKECIQNAKALAAKVKLNEQLYDHFPSEISGGEQQRVAIARGLSMQRQLLLADEPTGNLDSENSNLIIDILLNLAHQDKCCIIVVTHDLSVMDKADEVYRIVDGKLIKQEKTI